MKWAPFNLLKTWIEQQQQQKVEEAWVGEGMVTHACIPSYSRGWNERIAWAQELETNYETWQDPVPKTSTTQNQQT
jgi:hypothetical protein